MRRPAVLVYPVEGPLVKANASDQVQARSRRAQLEQTDHANYVPFLTILRSYPISYQFRYDIRVEWLSDNSINLQRPERIFKLWRQIAAFDNDPASKSGFP